MSRTPELRMDGCPELRAAELRAELRPEMMGVQNFPQNFAAQNVAARK